MKALTIFCLTLALGALAGTAMAQENRDDWGNPYTTIDPDGDRYVTTPQPDGGALTTNQEGDRWLTIPHGPNTYVTVMPDGSHVVTIRQ